VEELTGIPREVLKPDFLSTREGATGEVMLIRGNRRKRGRR
jgi:hypothetical protein